MDTCNFHIHLVMYSFTYHVGNLYTMRGIDAPVFKRESVSDTRIHWSFIKYPICWFVSAIPRLENLAREGNVFNCVSFHIKLMRVDFNWIVFKAARSLLQVICQAPLLWDSTGPVADTEPETCEESPHRNKGASFISPSLIIHQDERTCVVA